MELVVVAPRIDDLGAEMLKGHLAAEDIEAFIAASDINLPRGGGGHKVAVWKKDEQSALQIVAQTYPDQIALLKVPESGMITVLDGTNSKLDSFLQSGKNQVIALLLTIGLAAIIYLALYYTGKL
jgi:hypothetical protein